MDHDHNVAGALALALADRLGDATGAAAGVAGVPAAVLVSLRQWAAGQPIAVLADAMRLSHSRMVRVVDRLEAEGLARRSRDPADGRSALVAPTPAGRAAAARIEAARGAVLEQALAPLGAEDREELARLAGVVLGGLTGSREDARRSCRLCDAHACGHHEGRCPVTRAADAARVAG